MALTFLDALLSIRDQRRRRQRPRKKKDAAEAKAAKLNVLRRAEEVVTRQSFPA